MNRPDGLIRRMEFGLRAVLPLVAFAFAFALAWWIGRGVFIAIGAAAAAAIVTAIVRPRRPGRWTE